MTPHRTRAALAYAVAELTVLAITMGPVLGKPWWRGMRDVYAHDPLSYAAIATNASVGEWALTEPFTLTGVSHYPSAWYLFMGAVARLTGLPVHTVWTLLGVAVVSASVLTVGWVAQRISQRWWAPILPALALLTGTMSTLIAGYWLTGLGEHAVLWGPFVSLYVLNAEAAGVSLAAIALSLLVLTAHEASAQQVQCLGRSSATRIVVAAGLIGLLANIHTYSFFTATFLAAVFIAGHELLSRPGRAKTLATLSLPTAVLLLGWPIAALVGPLPVYLLLIAALAPALLPAARRHLRTAVAAATAFGILAAPQVAWTAAGLANQDPFLLYRQVSTSNLGIWSPGTAGAAVVWLLVLATIAIGLRGRRQMALNALVLAILAGWVVLPANDLWGFNQEPYRFWLQLEMIAGPLLAIPFAWVLGQPSRRPGQLVPARTVVAWLTTAAWLLSLTDFTLFTQYARFHGVIDLQNARADAVRALTASRQGLTMSSQCLHPRELKLITRGPVAEYSLGLAWPEDEPAFRIFHDPERRAGEDPTALQAAKVQWVLTDSACPTDWTFPADQRVVPVATQGYTTDGAQQQLTLWRVNPS